MRRLVYSPKVQAYISTDDGIIDISDFIVSGAVNRVVNEVSTAELVIRNPNMRWTSPGTPAFRPMDAITIFMSRYRNRPIQTFTGYLDETPYLQLFPGTCSLRASCTLKRLMYTYFDPGLPYTWRFLGKYGWLANPQTGQVQNPAAMAQPRTNEDGPPTITDGSIGNLLYATLNEIGNWDENSIIIENLPQSVVTTVQNLLQQLESDDEELKSEFNEFLKKMIGTGGGGSNAGAGSDAGGASGPLTGGSNPEKIFNYVTGRGMDCKAAGAVVGNAQQESGCNPASPGGYLLQWQGSRASGLANFARGRGKSITDLQVQLDWMWHELHNGYGGALSSLQGSGSVSQKTTDFCTDYEGAGIPMMSQRISYAQSAVDRFCKPTTTAGGPTR